MFYGTIEKIKVARFYGHRCQWSVSRVIVFLHSSTASGNNKEHLIAVFKYW